MDLAPIPQLVQKLVPSIGSTLFAGREKSGKSLMMLDLCLAVANGSKFMEQDMPIGCALYVALEDNPRRMRTRCHSLGYEDLPTKLFFAHSWGLIDGSPSATSQIREWHRLVKEKGGTPRLVVIDTLNFVRSGSGKNQDRYAKDCADVKKLTDLANKLELAIILVHHNNKSKEVQTPNDKISGTTGLPASVDNVVVLYEAHGKTLLSVKSRDMESGVYDVTFDQDTLKWIFLGELNEQKHDGVAYKIQEHLVLTGATLTPKEIAEAIAYKGNINTFLQRLIASGKIEREGRGMYRQSWPGVRMLSGLPTPPLMQGSLPSGPRGMLRETAPSRTLLGG
jgi:hypothetical protein